MPVSKSRKSKNVQTKGPTKSKKLDTLDAAGKGPSPRWYVGLMVSLMTSGVLLIVLNYIKLLPGSVSKWYLWSGLGLIGVGFLMTTEYR